MTASYEFLPGGRVQYYVSRMDVSFLWDTIEQCCRIYRVIWYDMAALMPREITGLVTVQDRLWLPQCGKDVEAEDYVAIQNMISHISHYRLDGTEELFVSDDSGKFYMEDLVNKPVCGKQGIREMLQGIRKKEEENDDYYFLHFMIMTPLIEKDHVGAKGSWHYIAYKMEEKGCCENGKKMAVSSGFIHAEFVKENNEWKIRTFVARKEYDLERTWIDGLFRPTEGMPNRECWVNPPFLDGGERVDPEDFFCH